MRREIGNRHPIIHGGESMKVGEGRERDWCQNLT